MNILTRHQIECDVCGETNEQEVSLKEAKKLWKENGWKMGKDTLCPQCQGVYSQKQKGVTQEDIGKENHELLVKQYAGLPIIKPLSEKQKTTNNNQQVNPISSDGQIKARGNLKGQSESDSECYSAPADVLLSAKEEKTRK